MNVRLWCLLTIAVVAGTPGALRAQTIARPGITVGGTATVKRPADAVRYTIVLAIRNGSATGESVFASADALVAALKRNGSPDAAVADPLNISINAQSVATVRGTLRKPTLASVRATIAAVTAALPADGVPIQQITYANVLDDCAEPQRTAEAAALDDARTRAAGIASAAHVTLGSVTAVSEGFGPQAGCPTRPDATFPLNAFGANALASDTFAVVLTVTLTVSFAIAP